MELKNAIKLISMD